MFRNADVACLCLVCILWQFSMLRLAPNDTAYKRWSCHSGLKLLRKLCRTSPPPGGPIYSDAILLLHHKDLLVFNKLLFDQLLE